METSKLQLAFLEDTIKHFNSTNRGLKTSGGYKCSYYAGCAIGRHLTKELCIRLDNFGFSAVHDKAIFDLLPQELQALGIKFLSMVQDLHDNENNWDEKGLTTQGLEVANDIKKYFGLEETIES
jgi:hypothetical protein